MIGASIARELSKYDLHTVLLEKEEDVCSGTSKANSAIVHAGFDAVPGSMKAKMNVEGNRMMEELSKDLDFPFRRNGSLVLCFSREQLPKLQELKQRGEQNKVPGLEVLSGEQARALEPNLSDQVCGALYAPTGGIVCPFELTLAMAENAWENGVEFCFQTEVSHVQKENDYYRVQTSKGCLTTKYVVNAAGVYGDVFHNMVSENKIKITPRRVTYCLLDKMAGRYVDKTIFQLPEKKGKGILVTPTVHGNLLLGPTATDLTDPEDVSTSAAEIDEIKKRTSMSVKNIPYSMVITSFAGLRACSDRGDFILGEPKDASGFFDAAGMESPGLTSAPAVGAYLAEQIAQVSGAKKKEDFKGTRKAIVQLAKLSFKERADKIRENPAYGAIVCRCEEISEGEIRDAINRPLGAVSMDGIKRRVRAGMGRCQAGFCTARVMEILAEEKGIPLDHVCKNSKGSELIWEE